MSTSRTRGISVWVFLVSLALVCLAEAAVLTDELGKRGDQGQPAKALRIAVADLTRIYRSYAKGQAYQTQLDEMSKAFHAREQGLLSRIQQLEDEIAGLSMGSPGRLELREESGRKRDELLRLRQEAAFKMDQALREGTLVVYEDITRAIGEYAKAHQIDLVLKQQTFEPNQPSAQDLSVRIGEGAVLYCAPQLDITEDISKMLNQAHQAAGKKEGKQE